MDNPGLRLRKLLLGATLFAAMMTSAQAMDVRANAQVPFKGGVFSSGPDAQERQQAVDAAKLKAWQRYTATFNPARMQSYKAIEKDVLAHIDDYIIDLNILDETVDKDAKRVSISIRASINESALNARLNAVGAGTAKLGGGNLFSFIFVARQAASHKAFDARRSDIRMEESALSASQNGSLSGGAAAVKESSTGMTKTTTGGSTQRRADDITYRIQPSADVDAAMTETLTGYGFDVVGYPDVVANCGGSSPDRIKDEFVASDEMTVNTRKGAIDAARTCSVNYFATGTLDVGMQDVDPVTGNKRVYVSVRGKVWDISGRLPRQVASVGPIQYAGLGPDAEVAARNALRLASESSAKVMVDQLNSRGLR